MENFVFANYREEPADKFRVNKLWTLKVNDYLKANLSNIKELMKAYNEPRKKTFDFSDAHRMFLNDIACKPVFKNDEIAYCWGLSKMTVVNEKKNYITYNSLVLVEFLEFLGRLAETRYPGDSIALEIKMDYMLQILLPQIIRKQPN